MARPSKSVAVLAAEKQSHRTKAELKQREATEKELASGKRLKERAEVKADPVAHKEYLRASGLLAKIKKNDALYERIINDYCKLQAESADMENIKAEFRASREQLEKEYRSGMLSDEDGGLKPSSYYRLMASMQANILALDKQIQAKRKMMMDIERECAMTISAAQRSIPKQPTKANPLAELLKGDV